jgi:hypothetical protein
MAQGRLLMVRVFQAARVLAQGQHVQDEGHFTTAQYGGAADGFQVLEQRAERFDDGLVLAMQGVHQQAQLYSPVWMMTTFWRRATCPPARESGAGTAGAALRRAG